MAVRVRILWIVAEFLYLDVIVAFIQLLWDVIVWFFTHIWDFVYYVVGYPMLVLKWFAMAFDWGAYFLYHYEEYLTSDFFTEVVLEGFGNVGETLWTIFWWVFFGGLYFLFWPITFPLTGAAVIAVLLFIAIMS